MNNSDFQNPIRWGVLGAANFAANHMAPAIHAAKGAKLAGIATSKLEKAAPFQAINADIEVFLDYDDMLASPNIDAVYIPLPNHLHVEWSLRAISAGKHVLCEKPMTLRAPEFDALMAARDKSGLVVAEAFMIAHHPQWIRAREIIQSGVLGKLVHVDAAFSYRNTDQTNIRNRPETGGGGLRDIGVYTLGAARLATGAEPVSITKSLISRENGVDVWSDVSADFDDFTYRSLTSTRMANRQEVVFQGETGVMKLQAPFNANVFDLAQIEVSGSDMSRRVERFPAVNHYVLQVENFGAAIRGGATYPWSLENAKGTQAMIDAIFTAADA